MWETQVIQVFQAVVLVGTMSADTLIACPLACQAQSSMYRSVTRSYTSLFSRKCKKGRFDYIYQFLRNYFEFYQRQKSEKSEKVENF